MMQQLAVEKGQQPCPGLDDRVPEGNSCWHQSENINFIIVLLELFDIVVLPTSTHPSPRILRAGMGE